MNAVIAQQIESLEGVYEVFCVNCNESIGTMRADFILRATLANSNRGGTLCPRCRKQFCDVCKTVHETKRDDILCQQFYGNGPRLICDECGEINCIHIAEYESQPSCLSSITYLNRKSIRCGK